jgi:hypothetical protein
VHSGCHNMLKLGEGTSRKAIYLDTMEVNIDRGHVGHLINVKCQKNKSACVLSDPGAESFEGISIRGGELCQGPL